MTDKELKNLSRADLLEMLIASEKFRSDEHEKSQQLIDELTKHIEELTHMLNEREIALEETGNLADACLRLNEVFTSAQNASEQYLDNIKNRKEKADLVCEKMISDCQEKTMSILKETQEKCLLLQKKAEEESKRILLQAEQKRRQTETECAQLKRKAKQMAEQYYKEKNGRLQEVLDAYAALESLIGANNDTSP